MNRRRITQLFLVKGRLIAYTSDIGESVRPVVPASVVRLAYGNHRAWRAVPVCCERRLVMGAAMNRHPRCACTPTTCCERRLVTAGAL